ncbi:hypothetical protein [Modestobacter altitudinis]|uniref:hypothetical protein n=1 Tax=Modestobacter altitudinis TaxID=2213158 RepID=UPI00110CB1EE|nr:hypothetical protein [Modestobacter altitudinis]
MTTPGTTATDTEDTAAGLALAEALHAVARLHEDAMSTIAQLAETGDAPADQVRVLRLAERPTVSQRPEAAAA